MDFIVCCVFVSYFRYVVGQNVEEGTILASDSDFPTNKTIECRAISECKSFLWLLQNYRTQQVLQDLVGRDCGFIGLSQMIWCPAEDNIDPLDLLEDEEEDDGDEAVRGGGILSPIISRAVNICTGSLTIMHYGDTDSDFKRIRMTGKRYYNLKILRNRVVVKVEAEGNCCWELHSDTGFRGQLQEAQPGYSDPPDIQPKSVRRVNC